jgi:predicted membrane protein
MMQEAGLLNFFRTILIILLILYGLKFIARYILPYVLTRAVKKAQERAQQSQRSSNRASEEVKVGETVIDKSSLKNKPSKSNDNVGEYVDYEEVDD